MTVAVMGGDSASEEDHKRTGIVGAFVLSHEVTL